MQNDVTVRLAVVDLVGLGCNFFCLSSSIKKLFNIYFSVGKSHVKSKFWTLGRILNPLVMFGKTETPKRPILAPNRVV